MGKAVSALQEAAIISITPLPVSFELNWIGVKSTWQGILAHISVLLAFLVFNCGPGRNGRSLSLGPNASSALLTELLLRALVSRQILQYAALLNGSFARAAAA